MDISTETTNHNETTVVDISNMLLSIARTGRMDRSWIEFRNIIEARIIEVLDQAHAMSGFIGPVTESFDSRKQVILLLLFKFDDSPPFTLQRLAEVLLEPTMYYRATHKLMNSLEKLLSVDT